VKLDKNQLCELADMVADRIVEKLHGDKLAVPKVGSVYLRGGRWFMHVKDEFGVWRNVSTGYDESQRGRAVQLMRKRQAELDARPRSSRPVGARRDKIGIIFALRLLPTMPNRLKVGFTASRLEMRLGQHRVTCPDLVVLARWRGTRDDETRAHFALPGRLRANEIFDVPDVGDALSLLDAALGERLP
jgi:hypothetical protein